ncbi:MAG: CBS domain-containing protein [Dissulfurispiraceae bacterium]
MADGIKIRKLMISIFDYPHVPYWFTIQQAVQLMTMAFTGREHPEPVAILVFDEKYNLVGTLGRNDLLRGLGPKVTMLDQKATSAQPDDAEAGLLWDKHFITEAKAKGERPVSETMYTVRHFIGPDEEITSAAYMMLRHNLQILPVLEGKKRLVGIIRMSEVFESLVGAVAGN